MGTLAEVASGLRDALAAIPGLTAYDVWTLDPTPPFAMPRLTGDTLDAFEGRATYRFEVVFGVSAANMPAAQRQLYALASRTGGMSVLLALEADPSLGGAAESVVVGELTGPFESSQIGGGEYLLGTRAADVLVGAT